MFFPKEVQQAITDADTAIQQQFQQIAEFLHSPLFTPGEALTTGQANFKAQVTDQLSKNLEACVNAAITASQKPTVPTFGSGSTIPGNLSDYSTPPASTPPSTPTPLLEEKGGNNT